VTLSWTRAAALVGSVRFKRVFRKYQFRRGSARLATGQRGPTSVKRKNGIFFPIFIGLAFVTAFTQLSFSIVNSLHNNVLEAFGSLQEIRRAWEIGFSIQLFLLWTASLLVSAADRELAKPEWDLEWLVTLPLKLRTLISLRVLEKAFSSQGLFIYLPFIFAFGWRSGLGLPSVGWMILLGLPLMLMSASLQTILDTALKLKLAPAKLRNLQAVTSIGGVFLMYVCLSPSKGSLLVVSWISEVPHWFLWSPFGLVGSLLSSANPTPTLFFKYGVLWFEALAFIAVTLNVTVYQLRNGVVAHSGRERARAPRNFSFGKFRNRFRWLSPLQARELKLLVRDRNFMVQTLVLPLLIIGSQLYFNAGRLRASFFGHNPRDAAAIVFGLSSYGLMFSAFQTLNFEGQSLWILFCLPRPLEKMIRDKTNLWSALVLIYPVIVLSIYFYFGGASSWQLWGYVGLAILGIPIYGLIAVSLGIFGSDPQASGNTRTTHVRFIYLYMALASVYTFAIFKATPGQTLTIVVLTTGLAFSLWQKAQDQLPFILDPTEMPPPRVSLADGFIAVTFFFVCQTIFLLVQFGAGTPVDAQALFWAFGLAGTVTYGSARFIFYRNKAAGIPRYFGPAWRRAVVSGIVAGLVAAGIAISYKTLMLRFEWFQEFQNVSARDLSRHLWFILLAVAAAPITEEFLFRGLIYASLRRSRNVLKSVIVSSAIFATVHPAPAFVPVFLLGTLAAVAYEISGLLLAPVLVHFCYNLGVLFL
jgi:ABC-2 type transport system permease protein